MSLKNKFFFFFPLLVLLLERIKKTTAYSISTPGKSQQSQVGEKVSNSLVCLPHFVIIA